MVGLGKFGGRRLGIELRPIGEDGNSVFSDELMSAEAVPRRPEYFPCFADERMVGKEFLGDFRFLFLSNF